MSRSLISLVVLAALAAGLAGGYFAAQRLPAAAPAATVAAEGATPAGKKILYYRNPMGLPDTSPTPKKDSMGMDYIPVYEGDQQDDAGVVQVSPARQQTLGVKTAPVELRSLDAPLRAVGRIEVDERAVIQVAPRFAGWIERLQVSATGDPVRRGQPLFTVYSPELESARRELAIAEELVRNTAQAEEGARQHAQALAAAARRRLDNWQVPGATRNGAAVTFHAPANGIVLEKTAQEGMRFEAGMSLYRIADLSRVWVMADVYEQDLPRIRVGQAARVSLQAYPERSFEARVAYLYPTVSGATRTTPVRLELDNREGLLRPGLFAQVELQGGGAEPRLAVPASAVIDDGARQVVLLARDGGRFEPRPVKLGLRGRDAVEVLEGLQAGDTVVVAANFLIDSESNLKSALANLTEGAAAAPAYEASGTLDAVEADGSVMLSHAPIAELKWPAMSMGFELASPALLQGLKPGAAIRFRFEDRGEGRYVVTRIDAAPRYRASGQYEGPGSAPGTLSLRHEPIAALQWPAMTMEFELADAALVAGLKAGSAVDFDFEDRGNGRFVVTAIRPRAGHGSH